MTMQPGSVGAGSGRHIHLAPSYTCSGCATGPAGSMRSSCEPGGQLITGSNSPSGQWKMSPRRNSAMTSPSIRPWKLEGSRAAGEM